MWCWVISMPVHYNTNCCAKRWAAVAECKRECRLSQRYIRKWTSAGLPKGRRLFLGNQRICKRWILSKCNITCGKVLARVLWDWQDGWMG